jgi:membrane protein DedA with SNARE-associated domain
MHWLLFAAHAHHRFQGPNVDYLGVGLAAAATWIGVAGVGEAVLIAAGIAASRGKLDISSVVFVAWLGASTGGAAGWLIGLKGGRALMTGRGPLYRLRLRLVRQGDRIYERRGWLAIFFAPSWMAGVSGVRAGKFLGLNALSAVIWALGVGLGAYFAGPSVADFVDNIGLVGAIVLALVVIGSFLAGRLWRRRASEH